MSLVEEGARGSSESRSLLVRTVPAIEATIIQSKVRSELALLDRVERYLVIGYFLRTTPISYLIYLGSISTSVESTWHSPIRCTWSFMQLCLRVSLDVNILLLF